MTVQSFLEDQRQAHAESTHGVRKAAIERFETHCPVEPRNAETKHIHKFLREEGTKYSQNTVESRYTAINLFFEFEKAIEKSIEDSPMEDLQLADYTGNGSVREADIKYVTHEEKDQLIEHVPDPKLQNELLIRLMFQTGLRRAECAKVKVDDIDLSEKRMKIIDAKDGEYRTVMYQQSLTFILDRWLDTYREPKHSPFLFPGKNGHIDPDTIGRKITQAAENAGIQEVLYVDAKGNEQRRITAHALRHGHAVHSLKCGIDSRFVQQQLGHDSIETTQRYLDIIEDDTADAYRQWNDDLGKNTNRNRDDYNTIGDRKTPENTP